MEARPPTGVCSHMTLSLHLPPAEIYNVIPLCRDSTEDQLSRLGSRIEFLQNKILGHFCIFLKLWRQTRLKRLKNAAEYMFS